MPKPTRPGRWGKSKSTNSAPWDRALKYLAIRIRSEKEIRDYLGSECTEEIITRLKELKFIDDVEFTRWYIEQRSRFRPRSQRMLAYELKRKGIDLPAAPDTEIADDAELAASALQKKLRLWGKLGFAEFRVKATRFLASRGFSWEVIERTVKQEYNKHNVT